MILPNMPRAICGRYPVFLLTILLAMLAAPKYGGAQIAGNYTFSQVTGTYVPITGGTVVATGSSLSDERYAAVLPFSFAMDGGTYTDIYLGVNGYISFGTANPGAGYWMIQSSTSGFRVASGFDANLAGRDASTELRYEVQGVSPNRVFVAQWKNFGFSGSTLLTTNFQIRLYEGSNNIEYCYGNVTLGGSSSNISVQVGLRGISNAVHHARSSGSSNWTATAKSGSATGNILYTTGNNPPNGLTYLFTPPPQCATPGQPTALILTPGTTNVSIDYTAGAPAANKYLIVRTPNVSLNTLPVNGTVYTTGNALGNGTVVYAGATLFYNNTGLSSLTNYTYTIFAYNETGCVGGPLYNTVNPLTGSVLTAGARAYTWNGTSGSGDYATATNWTPARTFATNDDTLRFANGGSVSVYNVPTGTTGLVHVKNNTSVTLSSTAARTLNLNLALGVDAGSTLTIDSALSLKYTSGPTKNAVIAGTLTLPLSGVYDAQYSATTVTGTVSVNGTAEFKNSCSINCTEISFETGSVYHHMRNGGTVPRASYSAASTVNFTGLTATLPTVSSGQELGNVIWNCAGQTTQIAFSTVGLLKGSLTVQNTGTTNVVIGNSSTANIINGNLVQTGGAIEMNGSRKLQVKGDMILNAGSFNLSGSLSVITLNGNMLQTSGHTLTKTAGISDLVFAGALPQTISLGGTVTSTALFNYTLNNPAGAVLTGTLYVNDGTTNTIAAGNWTGTGNFVYNNFCRLAYTGSANQSPNAMEWPATNGPYYLTINNTGAEPNNRVYLPGSRTISGSLTITRGVLVLNQHNLSMALTSTGVIAANKPGDTAMIAVDSTGQLIRAIASGASPQFYIFPVGSVRNGAQYSPVALAFGTNGTQRNIGVRVKPVKHPNNTAPTNYISRYWQFTDDVGTTDYSYVANIGYHAADVIGIGNIRLNTWNGSAWQYIPDTLVNNTFYYANTFSAVDYPLGGRDFTGLPAVNNTYTWTGAVDNDYQVAGNWNPNRTVVDPTDIVQFTNGLNNTVVNVPKETVARLVINNNTTVHLQTNVNAVFTIASDNNPATDELYIPAGSALYNDGAASILTMRLGGTNPTAKIDGLLEVMMNGKANVFNMTNGTMLVTAGGKIAGGGTINSAAFPAPSAASGAITIIGTYEHKFSTAAGAVPLANWGTGATLLITGYTTSTAAPNINYFLANGFYNFTYDCPSQTGNVDWSSRMPQEVRGTFKILSTGSGKFSCRQSSTGFNTEVNDFHMSGGTLDLNSSTSNLDGGALDVKGSFTKTGGTIMTTYTSGAGRAEIKFSGTTGTQNVMVDAAPTGKIVYYINNPDGINLTGLSGLTSFTMDSLSELKINTTKANPTGTNIPFKYQSVRTTLTYTAKGNYGTDAYVWPATFSPGAVTVDIGDTSVLTAPGSRTIARQLTMTSGDIDFGANSLTIGTSVQDPGTLLNSNSDNIRLTTGTLTRWFGTTGLPTSISPGAYFPISNGPSKRHVILWFSSSTALSAGGTITLGHNHANGLTTGLSVLDGSYTITSRTNASWNFTAGNGIAATGTVSAWMNGADLFTTTDPNNIRVMRANSVVGTHGGGGALFPDMYAQRSTLSLTDLTGAPFYLGQNGTKMETTYITVADGNWSNPLTWDQNTVPPPGSRAVIRSGDTVVVDTSVSIKILSTLQGSRLVVNDSTLNVDTVIDNRGELAITGGVVKLGPAGGADMYLSNDGTLAVTGGTMNINGSLRLNANSTFIQTGGTINLDGYGTRSVDPLTPILLVGTGNILATGGTIRFIDPHKSLSSSPGYTMATDNLLNADAVFGVNHTMIFGDGVSTSASPTIGGFVLDPKSNFDKFIVLGNVIIEGTPGAANGREVVSNDVLRVQGNMTLNNNGAGYDGIIYINGNLHVGTGATMTNSYMDFGSAWGPEPTVPQYVTGNGLFRSFTNSSVNVYAIRIRNASPGGVYFNIGDITSNAGVYFYKGKLNMVNSTLKLVSGSVDNASQFTGWVNGKLQMSLSYTSTYTRFPIGDSLSYAPVNILSKVADIPAPGGIVASTKAGDHPNIATSHINPLRSVNRTWELDTAGGINISPGALKASFNWRSADADPAFTLQNPIISSYNNAAWTARSVASFGSGSMDSVMISGLGNSLRGQYEIGNSDTAPAITQQPVSQTVCGVSNVSFSVTGAYASGYQWQVNTGSAWSNVYDNSKYAGAQTPTLNITGVTASMNGYQYRCRLYNSQDTSTSNAATLTVSASPIPTVSISASPGTTICAGTQVTFTAVGTNGGGAPAYQWKLNGNPVGSNSATYSTTTLANGDMVTCVMTSSLACASPTSATSNSLTMTVNAAVTPTITISEASSGTICAGANASFTAVVTNAGTTLAYQWKKNGLNVGTNSAIYTTTTLANGDVITCELTGTTACGTSTVTSNSITMTVNAVVTPSVTIAANPGTALCAGISVTFTATQVNGGTTPAYQWKKNGLNVGTNNNTYTDNALANNDAITCVLTSNHACANPQTATSNTLTMSVTPTVTPSVTIAANPGNTICAGTSVSFTATPVNGGTAPAYQWKVNGINAGTNSATYTTTTLANGDIVTCVLTSNASCATPGTATSNSITMTVNPVLTVSVTITANPGNTICSGTSVTFTATPTNGGTTPVYQWKKNGLNVGTSSNTYTDNGLANNDAITCELTGNATCVSTATVTSNTITMTVNTPATPSVSIAASPGTTICSGTSVTFTATPVNGGTTPAYQWKVNGINAGTNSATFTTTTLANNDAVTCVLITSLTCVTQTTATSNTLTMSVTPSVTPSVSIAASPSNSICAGTSVTFTATPVNEGATPAYQWKVNGINSGTNSTTFTTPTLANNDAVTCELTSSATCASPQQVTSNSITLTVSPIVTPSVTITANPGTTICAGQSVTFTATPANGGSAPGYQWKVNGSSVGTNNATFTTATLNNNDAVTCELTSNASCASTTTASSNTITMTVNPTVTPSVTITASPGLNVGPYTPITFTATPTNGGSAPGYQWQKNGVNIPGATGSTYVAVTAQDINSGDKITVVMTSNDPCASTATATSNDLKVQVDLAVTGAVQAGQVQMYPNPNKGTFRIAGRRSSTNRDLLVKITDIYGQTIYSKHIEVSSSSVDAVITIPEHVANGYYVLQVDGEQIPFALSR